MNPRTASSKPQGFPARQKVVNEGRRGFREVLFVTFSSKEKVRHNTSLPHNYATMRNIDRESFLAEHAAPHQSLVDQTLLEYHGNVALFY